MNGLRPSNFMGQFVSVSASQVPPSAGCLHFLNCGINELVAESRADRNPTSVRTGTRGVGFERDVRLFNSDSSPVTDSSFEASETPLSRDWGSLIEDLRGWARDIFFAAVAAVLIVIFVVQPVKVEGTSMQPNLSDQERIFVSKFIYHLSEIKRGDVIVFWYPNDVSKSFIKRVVGLPGNRVEIRDGAVYIDGKKLGEPYVGSNYRDDSFHRIVEVPPRQYFVLGDHRRSSNDSRSWGFVPEEQVFGKAVFRYWPLSKLGMIE